MEGDQIRSAIQILNLDEKSNSYSFNEEAVRSILCQDEIRDKPVCVLSVVGE